MFIQNFVLLKRFRFLFIIFFNFYIIFHGQVVKLFITLNFIIFYPM